MYACFSGSVVCMRMVHGAGADLNQRNHLRQTVLMKAVCYRDGRIVDWLLRKHADGTLYDVNNKTALRYAKDRKFQELVKKLDGSDIIEDDEYRAEEDRLTYLAEQRAEEEREQIEAARAEAARAARLAAEGPWGGLLNKKRSMLVGSS